MSEQEKMPMELSHFTEEGCPYAVPRRPNDCGQCGTSWWKYEDEIFALQTRLTEAEGKLAEAEKLLSGAYDDSDMDAAQFKMNCVVSEYESKLAEKEARIALLEGTIKQEIEIHQHSSVVRRLKEALKEEKL